MTSLKGSRAFLTSHVSGHFFQAPCEETQWMDVDGRSDAARKKTHLFLKLSILLSIQFNQEKYMYNID